MRRLRRNRASLHLQTNETIALVLFTGNPVELQNTAHRITREFEFFHGLLHGAILCTAPLPELREVEM